MSDTLADRGRHLVPEERRRQIRELLLERGSIAVTDVERGFRVSPMTARRDLALLAEAGQARRTHGGAVLPALTAHEDSFESRFEQDVAEKTRIAQAVASTLHPDETVFIDSSTTAHLVLRHVLEAHLAITLVTNSLPAIDAVLSAGATNIEVIGLGGTLRKLTRSFVGAATVRAIRDILVDRLLFSVKGIERGGFLTDPDPLEAEVKRAMIERSRTVVLVAAGRKFDERGLHVIAGAAKVDAAYLADPPRDGVSALQSAGVVVHQV